MWKESSKGWFVLSLGAILSIMQLLDAGILGLIQGLTEFLPVSSSGHLVAARFLFGISDTQGTAFDAFLHLGTLLAVLVYYRKVWIGIIRGIFISDGEGRDKRELAAKLALATVPAAIVGYAFQDLADTVFRSIYVVAGGLLLTALLLFVADIYSKRSSTIARATFKDAVLIGCSQVFALIPGISRSGITIAAGRSRGLSRTQAATFSFLLSAPIIAGAGLSSVGLLAGGSIYAPPQLIVGFLVSFLSGLAAISFLLKIVEKISFTPFIVYLVILATVLLVGAS